MLLYAFCSTACSVVCGFFAARTAANFAKTLRKAMFDRVTSFSAAEINKFGSSSLITRTTNDVVQMQTFVALGLQLLIKAPVLAVWSICKISSAAMEWTVATAIAVGVIVVSVAILVAVCYPKFRNIQRLTDNLNTATRESITGVRVVRAFNAESFQSERFEKVNESVMRTNLFTSRGLGLLMPIMTVCMNGLTLVVYFIGALLINDAVGMPQKVELFGNMTVFTQYALQVVMAFMLLIMIFMMLPRCLVSGRRIRDVLVTHRSVRSGSVKEVPHADGVPVLEFRNVSFGYDGNDSAVSDISFSVGRGETIAFIGATGSGKTTLVRMLLGELAPTAGRVERADFSAVHLDQEYRTLDSSQSVLETAERHNAHNLPDHELKVRLDRALFPHETWDKPCRALSGGERMRLSLCCMMLSERIPDLMVLDEPTNNLDIGSLAILTDTVRSYHGTLLVISHDEHFVREVGTATTVVL